jgi:hypothetical protein
MAADIQTASFDAKRLREVLPEIRGLTRREPFTQIITRVQELCATAGVALVLTPELGETRLSGGARWLSPDKAIIQLSLRHKSDDHFWFSFFHEVRHLLGRKREDFVDAADADDGAADKAEQEADSSERSCSTHRTSMTSRSRSGGHARRNLPRGLDRPRLLQPAPSRPRARHRARVMQLKQFAGLRRRAESVPNGAAAAPAREGAAASGARVSGESAPDSAAVPA